MAQDDSGAQSLASQTCLAIPDSRLGLGVVDSHFDIAACLSTINALTTSSRQTAAQLPSSSASTGKARRNAYIEKTTLYPRTSSQTRGRGRAAGCALSRHTGERLMNAAIVPCFAEDKTVSKKSARKFLAIFLEMRKIKTSRKTVCRIEYGNEKRKGFARRVFYEKYADNIGSV